MRKISQSCVVGLLLLLALSTLAFAAIPNPTGKVVNDLAGILKDTSGIDKIVSDFKSKNPSIDITVLTVPSLEGMTIEQYGRHVLDKWGGNRALLLIAAKEGEVRLAASRTISGVLTDSVLDSLRKESEKVKGGSARATYIVDQFALKLNGIKPSVVSSGPATAPVPQRAVAPPPPVKPLKAKSEPISPIWYVLLALIAIGCITAPIFISNSKRKNILSSMMEDCEAVWSRLKEAYSEALDELNVLMENFPKNVAGKYENLLTISIDNFDVQVGALKRKCGAFFVSKSLAGSIKSLYNEINDLLVMCESIINLRPRLEKARANAIHLYNTVIPLSMEGISAELEKNKTFETIRTDYLTYVSEYQSIVFDAESKDIDWLAMESKLSSISGSLNSVKRCIEGKKEEVHQAQERATKMLNDMPSRLAEAERRATTAEARQQVAEARAEYERALAMQRSSGPDIIDWIILDSMLNHSHHTVQTVYVPQPVYTAPVYESSYGHRGGGHSDSGSSGHYERDEEPAPRSYGGSHSDTGSSGRWTSDDDDDRSGGGGGGFFGGGSSDSGSSGGWDSGSDD